MRKIFLMVMVFSLTIVGIAFADLVAHYSFNGNLNDFSGNNLHGIGHGGVSYSDGILGQAAMFDGIDDYIEVAEYQNFEFQDDFTISFWRKNLDDRLSYHISCSLDRNRYQFSGWGIHTASYAQGDSTPDGVGFGIIEGSNSVVRLGYQIDDINWDLITVTKTNSQLALYINGIQVDSATNDSPVRYQDHYFIIGANQNDGIVDLFHYGMIDDVRLYDHALTASEIEAYLASVPIPGAVWLLGTGLIGLAGFRKKLRS